MTTHIKEPKFILWVLFPVSLALLLSAWVGLQLFQDGSSYLLEMLIDHSAVRHGRVSILLFQYPTIFLIKTFSDWGADTLETLLLVRLAFNLNYAIAPFISIVLSWLVVRKKREELFIWAAFVILFVNLVNFSWVSELLIAVQLSCPLLLALLQNPRSKTFWSLFLFLTPFFFFLHPLVVALYLGLAAVSAYIAYREPTYRSVARLSMILFLLAALGRGVYSFFTLNPYEVSLVTSGEASNYFAPTRWENILFLMTAVEVAFLVLLSRWILNARRLIMNVITGFVLFQAFVFLLLNTAFLLRANPSPLVILSCIVAPALFQFWYVRSNTSTLNTRTLYLGYIFLSVMAGFLLMAQYVSSDRMFTLKTGLALFAALLILLMAAIDSGRDHTADEHLWRFRFVVVFAMIFTGVMIAKSLMWWAAVHKLEQSLLQTEGSCLEITSAEFRWLETSPYTIINNWSLPSLALVIQDEQPRKALLAQNDCRVLQETGMIQVDPWSLFSKEFVVPPLE
jgi:hypothetical protein